MFPARAAGPNVVHLFYILVQFTLPVSAIGTQPL